MALLPSFFMLQSGCRYLSVTDDSGLLKFDEEQIWSPRAKFAAEPAADGSGLFHIRSLYNNKYLITKQIETNSWIVASAKKTEDDKSKASSCTLFEPHSASTNDDDQTKTVCLWHVGTGVSVTHHDTHHGVVLLSSSSGSSSIGSSSFIVRDSNNVLVLPTRIAFKSQDLNGNYLGSVTLYDKLIYQKFEPGLDLGDPRVTKKLVPTPDGNYHIQDLFSGKFWGRKDGWIKAQWDTYDQTKDTLFSFVQIKGDVVALRNMGNNAFCGAYSDKESINCLNARYPTLSKQTKLIIEDPVIERKISEVKYRLSDSRIHNEHIQEVDHQFGYNNSQNFTTMTLTFSTTDSRTTSWNNSMSINFGVKVAFEVSVVPFIAKSQIEVSTEFGYTHEWGGSQTRERKRESSYTVQVPPKKTMKVRMMVTTGVCDVPFSYTQRDLLPSGDWVETKKSDGIFKGINSYDIHYKSEEVPN